MNDIALLIVPERAAVRVDQRSELDVVLEVRTSSSTAASAAGHALNLAIVLDRSGSMEGEKLDAAKASCSAVLKSLRASDKLTVVVFDDEAEVVVNPQITREAAGERISSIVSGGQTNLALGWYLGLLELQTHSSQSHNNRALLLSDGQANAGETKKSILANEAAKARDLGITTSTIGIGDDFQEDLLEAIATESGGRFWYIKDSRIEDIIEEEFQGSLSVALDRPRLELRLPADVTVSRELNQLSRVAGRYRFRPLKNHDFFNLAVRLQVEPGASGDIPLSAVLYDGDRQVCDTSLLIRRVEAQEHLLAEVNPLVASVVQQFQASVSNEQMLAGLGDGDLNLMKKMLIAEVDGMRKVQDALESEREDERAIMEIRHIGMDMAMKGASIAIADMLELYPKEPEVQSYVARWRKSMRHGMHRMRNRVHSVADFDEDLFNSLIEGALNIADTLISRYPDNAEALRKQQEVIRGHLERR